MQNTTSNRTTDRVVFLDYLRVIACFMVIVVHASEIYYLGDETTFRFAAGAEWWVTIYDSLVRSCVPLFVMTTSYLLLPLHDEPFPFYRKRFVRVVIPAAVWALLYCVLPFIWGQDSVDTMTEKLVRATYNFNWSYGHFWYIYMIVGLYLFMPLLSPWFKTTSKRFEQFVLGFWAITTTVHFFKTTTPELLGEASWNEFGTLYYFSGYIGYLVLAHYIRTYIHWERKKLFTVGSLFFLGGFVFTVWFFYAGISTASSYYELEICWRFCTPNIAAMATGGFLMAKALFETKRKTSAAVSDISRLSYGMYLAHMFVLGGVAKLFGEQFPASVSIPVISAVTFVLTYLLIKVLSYLPKSKYLVG